MMFSQDNMQQTVDKGIHHAYFERKDRTLLIVRGSEGRDFIQRMSTNDVSGLGRAAVQTAFTTEKGKIIDVVTVLNLGSDSILLAGISGDQGGTKAWLERFIIMDDVSIHQASAEFRHFLLIDGDLPRPSLSGTYQFQDDWGLHLILPAAVTGAFLEQLTGEGYKLVGADSIENYRVTRGLPDWPSELSGEYNPLEARLGGAISWTKGCYVGQEVIARLDTFKKLQRVLVKLSLTGTSQSGLKLYLGENSVGIVTSVSAGSDGKHQAIGYVKPVLAVPHTVLEVGAPGSGFKAIVREE